MADTKRQKIVDAFLARMREIQPAAGYETDIGSRVWEWRTDFDANDQPDELPALSVCDLPEQSRDDGLHVHALTIQARIFLKSADRTGDARKIIGDVIKAIGTDPEWAGLALGTKPKMDGFIIPPQSFSVAGAAVEVVVEYVTGAFNPFE